jgi:hypothetical protein
MYKILIGMVLITATPAVAQLKAPGPANKVTDTSQGIICSLDIGISVAKGEGSCTEYLGVCAHENGYKTPCYACTPMGNCRPIR